MHAVKFSGLNEAPAPGRAGKYLTSPALLKNIRSNCPTSHNWRCNEYAPTKARRTRPGAGVGRQLLPKWRRPKGAPVPKIRPENDVLDT